MFLYILICKTLKYHVYKFFYKRVEIWVAPNIETQIFRLKYFLFFCFFEPRNFLLFLSQRSGLRGYLDSLDSESKKRTILHTNLSGHVIKIQGIHHMLLLSELLYRWNIVCNFYKNDSTVWFLKTWSKWPLKFIKTTSQ